MPPDTPPADRRATDDAEGIEAATRVVFGTPTQNGQRQLIGEAIAAYERARSSPDRRVRELEKALKTAADDLDKAANQFEGIRQSQAVGHVPLVSANPGRFAAKAQRARAALHPDQSHVTAP